MNARLTVVIDNCVPINADAPFLGEHGLSMLLETGGARMWVRDRLTIARDALERTQQRPAPARTLQRGR